VPQETLLQYLTNIGTSAKPNETPGMDCSVVKIEDDKFVVSTTDFFYPLVPDPLVQGRIAACNVLSDMYSMGITTIDTMLMILGVSLEMSAEERDIVTTLMIKGFSEVAAEAGTSVTGGQTVLNPWPMIGGTASRCCAAEEFIRPEKAVVGDVLVLTKPLGTQVAVNAMEWLGKGDAASLARLSPVLDEAGVLRAFRVAADSMNRLNRSAALLMHKYHAHAATDVTGFGILGHARNLAQSQHAAVDLEVHTLPVIRDMVALDEHNGRMFKLLAGRSSETSGGLLVCLPEEHAQAFVDEMAALDGRPAWIVGRVVARQEGAAVNDARIAEDARLIEVDL